MKSILSIQYVPRFYECNIDLSKSVQVKGVTNLSDMPILQVHSSVPYTEDGQYGTSTLDAVLTPRQPTQDQNKQSFVSDVLDLNLI